MNADGEDEKNINSHGSDGYQGSDPGAAAQDATAGEPGPGEAQQQDDQPGDAQQQDPQRRTAARTAVPGGVLPNKAAEDDPRRWGDQPGSYDHDAWLQEQKPPHWG
jgi:cell division protein FtsN